MKEHDIQELQRTLDALDARDALNAAVKVEIEKITSGSINPMALMQKAGFALAKGSLSPATFGLPENFFEQIQQLEKINTVATAKLRAHTLEQIEQLKGIDDAEVVSHA